MDGGAGLRIRELPSGSLLASAPGKGLRLLGWRPDGARIAVAEVGAVVILDAVSLKPVVGETLSWNPPAPPLSACPGTTPVWQSPTQFAAPCGSIVMVSGPAGSGLLQGHTDRVVGVAWSPSGKLLASVSEDNYARIWDVQSRQCVAVSEDYPYPRALYFSDERTVVVLDVALRRYEMHYQH
jgi:WD40 repeat protein